MQTVTQGQMVDGSTGKVERLAPRSCHRVSWIACRLPSANGLRAPLESCLRATRAFVWRQVEKLPSIKRPSASPDECSTGLPPRLPPYAVQE